MTTAAAMAMATATVTRRAGGQQRVLAQMKAKGPLRLQDVQVMMHSLNAKIAPKKLRAAFVEADADKSGKLEWGEFCALFRTLQSRPACLPALFAAACPAGKTELAVADLQRWRKEQQLDEAVSLADCEAIVDGFSGGELAAADEQGFGLDAFGEWMMDGDGNGAFDPAHAAVYQDMRTTSSPPATTRTSAATSSPPTRPSPPLRTRCTWACASSSWTCGTATRASRA